MNQKNIRKAKSNESLELAEILLPAMEEIVYEFIGRASREAALNFLENLILLPSNQYSYENIWVIEENGNILGAAIVYDGAKLHALRKPVATKIRQEFGIFFSPEDETEAGEFYIDCIGVHQSQQGRGIGSELLHHLIQVYAIEKRGNLGLLVDEGNPKAKKLYVKLGFRKVGETILVKKRMDHLQYRLDNPI